MAVAETSHTPAGSPGTGNSGTATSFTYLSFAISGTNPAVVIDVALDISAGAASVSSVAVSAGLSGTIQGSAAIKANTAVASRVEYWAIAAPSGTGTITVTLSASKPYQSSAHLMSGADQTTPCPTADAVVTPGNGSTNPLSATPTNLTANDAAVGCGSNANTGDGPTINQTQTYNQNTTTVNMAAGYHLGTGAMTCTWGVVTTDSQLMAVRVQAAAGATVASLPDRIRFVRRRMSRRRALSRRLRRQS